MVFFGYFSKGSVTQGIFSCSLQCNAGESIVRQVAQYYKNCNSSCSFARNKRQLLLHCELAVKFCILRMILFFWSCRKDRLDLYFLVTLQNKFKRVAICKKVKLW